MKWVMKYGRSFSFLSHSRHEREKTKLHRHCLDSIQKNICPLTFIRYHALYTVEKVTFVVSKM